MEGCLTNATVFTHLSDFGDKFAGQVELESATLILLFICAITSNVLMLTAIVKTRKVLCTTNILLTNLVTSGLLFSLFIPATVITRITAEWKFSTAFCKLYNHIEFVSGMSSNLTLTAISYDRYMTIRNDGRHRLSKRILIAIVLTIWIISSLFAVPVPLYQDVMVFHKTEEICQVGNNGSHILPPPPEREQCRLACRSLNYCGISWPDNFNIGEFLIILSVIFYIVPLVCFLVFYTSIFLIVRRSSRRVAQSQYVSEVQSRPPNADPSMSSKPLAASRHEIRLVKMSGVIITSFIFMWAPFFVMTSVSHITRKLTSSTYILAVIFAHANVCVNPIIYGYFNPAFREQCRQLPQTLLKFVGVINSSVFPQSSKTKVRAGINTSVKEEQQ